jgi:hypothetical protein
VWRWTPYPNPVSCSYVLLNNNFTTVTTWYVAVYYCHCSVVIARSFHLRNGALCAANYWHDVQGKWTECWLWVQGNSRPMFKPLPVRFLVSLFCSETYSSTK